MQTYPDHSTKMGWSRGRECSLSLSLSPHLCLSLAKPNQRPEGKEPLGIHRGRSLPGAWIGLEKGGEWIWGWTTTSTEEGKEEELADNHQ